MVAPPEVAATYLPPGQALVQEVVYPYPGGGGGGAPQFRVRTVIEPTQISSFQQVPTMQLSTSIFSQTLGRPLPVLVRWQYSSLSTLLVMTMLGPPKHKYLILTTDQNLKIRSEVRDILRNVANKANKHELEWAPEYERWRG